MTEHQLADYLKENLSLEVETSSYYTGDATGLMYTDCKRVQLKLNNIVISEAYL